MSLCPLRFVPILKRRPWGGRRLQTVLGRPLPDDGPYGESWEVADHGADCSVVAEGPLAGTTLRALLERDPEGVLGQARPARGGRFPLLVKFLDAREPLSLQVHPDDEAGARLAGDSGKTEAWVVLDAPAGSVLYAGLAPGTTPSVLRRALARGTPDRLLRTLPARPGECLLIPAGTVHAIGGGVLLAEIQQTSDATFRIYDWGRVGEDGRPRQLHLAQALECIDWSGEAVVASPPPVAGGVDSRVPLARSSYFEIWRRAAFHPADLGQDDRFTLVLGLQGRGRICSPGGNAEIAPGGVLLLPATLGACRLEPGPEGAVMLECAAP